MPALSQAVRFACKAKSAGNQGIKMKIVCAAELCTDEDTFEYNRRIGRYLSPHLTIYKPQLTSILSITHRMTGFVLSSYISCLGLSALIFENDMTDILTAFEELELSNTTLMAMKLCLSLPFCYHFFNGVRHLAWDAGYGFKIPDLYRSGYAVMVMSVIASSILSSM